MTKITIKDIANQLNISKSTVSKALKGYSDVSEKTRKKVLRLANKYNFKPNSIASSLRTKRTKTIGVLVPSIVHDFFANVVDGIITEAEKHNYLVVVLQSSESVALEEEKIKLLKNRMVDGILLSVSNETGIKSKLNEISKKGIPIVLFDKIIKSYPCSKVVIDDKKAAYDAVSYLIDKGYKKIAHFGGVLTAQNSIDRFLGYKQALFDHGLKYDSSLVYINPNDDDLNDGYHNAEKLMHEHPDVDAVFAITDLIALGIYKYCHEKNIDIPNDLAVFGFSNWLSSFIASPQLTTVNQPGFEMGQKATEILLTEIDCKINDKPYSYQNVVLPTNLLIREST
ncbi:MAG: LacI family DNA-binding transcriptional regulator [Putridiphycobacter sp.]